MKTICCLYRKGEVMKKLGNGFIWGVCLVLLCGVYSVRAVADVILLENGDRLTGEVTELVNGVVTIETEYAEPIKIRADKVTGIETDRDVEVHMKTGEVIKGRLANDGGGELVVGAAETRGSTVVKWSGVEAINPSQVQPVKWTGSITVGAGLSSGNSDIANVSVGGEAQRRTEDDRYSVRFLHNYAEEDDKITSRNTYGAAKYDYFFSQRLFGYLGFELLNDDFRDLNLRTVVGPGIGYQVWEDPVRSLLFEGGLSFFSEDREESEDDDWISGRLAVDLRYEFFDAVIFSDRATIYPSLSDFGEYQLRNEAALLSALSAAWSLKLSSILERDSSPPDDIEKNDWHWVLGLQYGFN
jgi:putative salt-induced outer membrane protein YdiY